LEGGQNPITLIREMYSAMTWYATGAPLSRSWNGSLLGDTGIAIGTNNKILLLQWPGAQTEAKSEIMKKSSTM